MGWKLGKVDRGGGRDGGNKPYIRVMASMDGQPRPQMILIPQAAIKQRLRFYGIPHHDPPTRAEKLRALRAILNEHHVRLSQPPPFLIVDGNEVPNPAYVERTGSKQERAGGMETGIAIDIPAAVQTEIDAELDGI